MLSDFSEGKMVDYLNSELCNTLANLLSRCTSKSINSSQLYPPFNAEVFESAATEEWRELMDSLNSLPGLSVAVFRYSRVAFPRATPCLSVCPPASHSLLSLYLLLGAFTAASFDIIENYSFQ